MPSGKNGAPVKLAFKLAGKPGTDEAAAEVASGAAVNATGGEAPIASTIALQRNEAAMNIVLDHELSILGSLKSIL